MIKLNKLSYGFPAKPLLYSDLDLTINPGSFVGLLGPNGAGKSTLLELIMGLRTPISGDIKIKGISVKDPKSKLLMGYISHSTHLADDLTGRDIIQFKQGFYPELSMDRAEKLAKLLEVNLDAAIGSLSTGQKKKVLVCTVLCIPFSFVVVDEITAVLDPKSRMVFFSILQSLQKDEGTTILFATNIVEDLHGHADIIYGIHDQKCFELSAEDIQALTTRKKAV